MNIQTKHWYRVIRARLFPACRFFSTAPGWALRLALLVGLLTLSAPMPAPVASAEIAPPLLRFTAGGHVVGFAPTQVVMAAFDHALRVEFVGTAGVTPVASAAASSGDGLTLGRAQPLGVVTYPEVWRGVSIEYRAGEESIVKSTYTVAPGADAAQIRLRYNVPVELQSDGSLQFAFERGYVSESAPLAWQEIDGARVPVPVAFTVLAGGEVGFRLGAYDPHYPLTIDPNYVWHTFYGSGSEDYGYGIAVDGSNNVYITGSSRATWQGPDSQPPIHAHSTGSGNYDIVVVKLNSAGTYQWHTFYGSGDDSDAGYGIAVDRDANVYIAGYSEEPWQGDSNAPPLNAFSGTRDIVLLKLNSAGTYQWHTFYGVRDSGNGIALDGSGNIYVVGRNSYTWKGPGGQDPLHPRSDEEYPDIVVVKLNSAGAYQWHTFYGTYLYNDFGSDIAVDGSSAVYITGYSERSWLGDYNTSPIHAHSETSNYYSDVVVLKLNGNGVYQWHTFYGANRQSDYGRGIAVDASSNVYVTGESYSTWLGDNNTPPLHTPGEGGSLVVLKLTSAGAYQWHTFYGSPSGDSGNGITVDGSNNLYVTGYSRATWQGDGGTNPLHAHSGDRDIVVLKLNSAGAYQWHTFYGSSSWDYGNGIAVASNHVYVTGYSGGTWQGDGNANPLHGHSGLDDIVALKLGEYYTLTVATAGSGSGTVVKTPDAPSYPAGTVVTLTAYAASGSYFGGWSGDASGLTNPITVTMDADKWLTATFTLRPVSHTLTIATAGDGHGVVTPTVGAHEYLSGTVVVVTATAQADSDFGGWSGACSGLSPTCTVTMDANKWVTATFTLKPGNHAPTANAGADQSVKPGDLVTLDGSGSSDPDGDPLTYFWQQIGGVAVSFTPTLSRTTFTAPVPGVLTFTLTVTDTGGLSASDSVVITVVPHRIYLPLVLRNGP